MLCSPARLYAQAFAGTTLHWQGMKASVAQRTVQRDHLASLVDRHRAQLLGCCAIIHSCHALLLASQDAVVLHRRKEGDCTERPEQANKLRQGAGRDVNTTCWPSSHLHLLSLVQPPCSVHVNLASMRMTWHVSTEHLARVCQGSRWEIREPWKSQTKPCLRKSPAVDGGGEGVTAPGIVEDLPIMPDTRVTLEPRQVMMTVELSEASPLIVQKLGRII